jgi:DNA-directed RNA polymerase specialized sigma24 family protein
MMKKSNLIFLLKQVAQARIDRANVKDEEKQRSRDLEIRLPNHMIDFIKENAESKTAYLIAKELDLDVNQVRRAGKKLNVKFKPVILPNKEKKEKLSKILKMLERNSMSEVAQLMDMKQSTIRHWLSKAGISLRDFKRVAQ